MNYKHTQIGYLPIVLIAILLSYFFSIYISSGDNIPLYVWLSILFIVFLLFYNLTVEIDDIHIEISYWIWIIKKSFLLSDIKSFKAVKNKWYHGWGIRIWFWPKMWIYNISWFDAIELILSDNKIVRIWTDDIENLTEALNEILNFKK